MDSLLHSFCQMVVVAVDLQQSSHVYLLEAGLDLWQILVESSNSPLPQPLLELFPGALVILLEEPENTKVALEIIKGYLAYRDPNFCLAHIAKLAEFFLKISTLKKTSWLVNWLKTIEFAQRCYPVEIAEPLIPVVRWCLETVLGDFESLSLGVLHHLLTICARFCLGSIHLFKSTFSQYSQDSQYQFLSIWVEKTGSSCLSHDLERRKANSMALLQLCQIPDR